MMVLDASIRHTTQVTLRARNVTLDCGDPLAVARWTTLRDVEGNEFCVSAG